MGAGAPAGRAPLFPKVLARLRSFKKLSQSFFKDRLALSAPASILAACARGGGFQQNLRRVGWSRVCALTAALWGCGRGHVLAVRPGETVPSRWADPSVQSSCDTDFSNQGSPTGFASSRFRPNVPFKNVHMQTAGEWMALWFLITQEFKMMVYDMGFTSLAGPPCAGKCIANQTLKD